MAKSPLTEKDKAEIRRLHETHKLPYAAIAVRYGVSSATISRVCNPETAAKLAAANKLSRPNYAAKEAAQAKIRYKSYSLKFHRNRDADIIAQLDKQENKLDYIRKLIQLDIQPHNKDSEDQ